MKLIQKILLYLFTIKIINTYLIEDILHWCVIDYTMYMHYGITMHMHCVIDYISKYTQLYLYPFTRRSPSRIIYILIILFIPLSNFIDDDLDVQLIP